MATVHSPETTQSINRGRYNLRRSERGFPDISPRIIADDAARVLCAADAIHADAHATRIVPSRRAISSLGTINSLVMVAGEVVPGFFPAGVSETPCAAAVLKYGRLCRQGTKRCRGRLASHGRYLIASPDFTSNKKDEERYCSRYNNQGQSDESSANAWALGARKTGHSNLASGLGLLMQPRYSAKRC